ncbi:glycosyltransferase family 8 protein [Psychrobacillus psychrodurans]|uniref:Lipopolysaccharide biosynthesis protein, LPS:glycosyltransferase n=1 Tax=Psychrobacillus psychrodurans TaxID=126157 RepID=A0A9X3L6A5_9BACI|nr:glycosyltransferase [Psychrobacillus psychrodurans]MCZ8532018.1 hypothetical protein [Psychrobacillus psychrodurans]
MRLNVAYATGEEYAKQAGVSIISLFENNAEFDEITVYIIDNGIKDETRNILIKISERYNRLLVFINSTDIYDADKFKSVGNYSGIIFSKMYLHRIEDIDKIIYIDCDMIMKSSFIELWNMDIEDYLVAGVRMPTPIEYRKRFSSGNDEKYINGGFILFNLNKWRNYDVESRIDIFMQNQNEHEYIEENIICSISEEKILNLEPKYNLNGLMIAYSSEQIKKITSENYYYTQEQLDMAKLSPTVIHFSSEIYERPWYLNCDHPFKNEYLYYLSLSPWKSQLEKKHISLITKAKKIIKNKLPFNIYLIMRKLLK